MIRGAVVPVRRIPVGALVLGVLACMAAGLGLSATPTLAAPACPNEQIRQESNTNPTTKQPYSAGLPGWPDCRAYEMVSPLYKQGHAANGLTEGGLPAAPAGETAGWASQGDFANPENFSSRIGGNAFLSQRGAAAWGTSSVFAPRNLVDYPFQSGLEGDSSPDLRSVRVSCGSRPAGKGERSFPYAALCARREGEGPWMSTPLYQTVNHEEIGEGPVYLGGSSDLSRVFLQPRRPILSSDTLRSRPLAGIYEIAGCCTASSTLRLVNVDNEGKELVLLNKVGLGQGVEPPLLGDMRAGGTLGSRYHAISANGGTVFFTATTSASPPKSEILTVYARINCGTNAKHSSAPSCTEDGDGEWFETVEVSNPSPKECSACKVSTRRNATFQAASADGSKIFFTTTQQLLSKEVEGAEGVTPNLYEYDFNKPEGEKLSLLSPDPEGANVTTVARTSPDGSHVYFVATGKLPSQKNGNSEEAAAGESNLYGYDTVTGETKFVAKNAGGIFKGGGVKVSRDTGRPAQTTPDGRYLVFSSPAQLAGATSSGEAVYRYDFQTGSLEWVSHAVPGFTATNEGKPALVAPLPGTQLGAEANIDDWQRAISEDGQYIIFTTAEKLQASDVNNAPDLYEWHEGTVTMISDGHDPEGVERLPTGAAVSAISASASDIFFLTHTPLVGQDTDVLGDLYDARVGGGFSAPEAEPSCSHDACQGLPSAPPSFGSAASSVFTGGRNLTPPAVSVAPSMISKPKPLTRAQQLAKARKACKGKPKRKRALCESQARKKYGGSAKSKKSDRRGK